MALAWPEEGRQKPLFANGMINNFPLSVPSPQKKYIFIFAWIAAQKWTVYLMDDLYFIISKKYIYINLYWKGFSQGMRESSFDSHTHTHSQTNQRHANCTPTPPYFIMCIYEFNIFIHKYTNINKIHWYIYINFHVCVCLRVASSYYK